MKNLHEMLIQDVGMIACGDCTCIISACTGKHHKCTCIHSSELSIQFWNNTNTRFIFTPHLELVRFNSLAHPTVMYVHVHVHVHTVCVC